MFGSKDKNSRISISDVVRGDRKKLAEQTRRTVFEALQQTETQKNLYATMAQRAINKARVAIASNDDAGKSIAYSELKFSYGVYQYMSALHNAFRTIKSQMDMQEMTASFAEVVDNLCKIRIPDNSFNFDKLTAKALSGFAPADMDGLNRMAQKLIEGSTQATNISNAPDSFLDKLISGEVTLDTPYSAVQPQAVPVAGQTQAGQTQTDSSTDELLAMLDAINSHLRS